MALLLINWLYLDKKATSYLQHHFTRSLDRIYSTRLLWLRKIIFCNGPLMFFQKIDIEKNFLPFKV